MSEKTEQEEIKPEQLKAAIRLEIVKPIGMSWDELGLTLRTQRMVMGQLVQAAVDAHVSCAVAGLPATKSAVAPKARAESASGLAYQAVLRELERIREGKWSDAQREALEISSNVLSSLAQRGSKDFAAWRSAQYSKRKKGHGKRGRASYGAMQPIPIHNRQCDLELVDGKPELTFTVCTKREFRVAVAPSRGIHWEMVRRIASGELKHGDCKLLYSENRKKWFAILSHARPALERPTECDPEKILALHRGARNLFTAMNQQSRWKVLATGDRLLRLKRQLDARRAEAQGLALGERGRGRRGHGRARRYEFSDSLSRKEADYIKTLCQQMAARAITLARAWGCGTIVIEDYGGIDPNEDEQVRRHVKRFPLFQLKEAVSWACKKNGLNLQEVPSVYISSTCPKCGNVDTNQHNIRTNMFHCANCKFDRHADWVAAYHMVQRATG